MKDAQGHGSNARGGNAVERLRSYARGAPAEEGPLYRLKPNWLAGALAAMKAHYTGGAINQDPHSNKIRRLP